MHPIKRTSVNINLPLFDALLNLETNIRQYFRLQKFSWDAVISINLERPTEFVNGGYYCTPLNTLKFASTGMDGEHFSFLVLDQKITSESPIIFTAPCNYGGDFNVVIAANFYNFMCLGIRYGFFALGQLAAQPEEALQVYTSLCWPLQEEYTFPLCADNEQKVLAYMAYILNLQPYIYTAEEFAQLQNCYRPLLRMSAGYYELCAE